MYKELIKSGSIAYMYMKVMTGEEQSRWLCSISPRFVQLAL